MDEEYIIQDLFKEYRYSLKKIKNKLKKSTSLIIWVIASSKPF